MKIHERLVSVLLVQACLCACRQESEGGAPLLELTASAYEIEEGAPQEVVLLATSTVAPLSSTWEQVSGPRLPLWSPSPLEARVDTSPLAIAADTELVFRLSVDGGSGALLTSSVTVVARARRMSSLLGERVQIGGATTELALVDDAGEPWVVYNHANRLDAARVSPVARPESSLRLAGFVHDLHVVQFHGNRFLLAALGSEGVAVVDAADPTALRELWTVKVAHQRGGITYTDRGGNVVSDHEIASSRAPIVAIESDGEDLWLADEGFGILRTPLDNLLGGGGPAVEADGSLLVETRAFTLLFAGEEPWGGPRSLELRDGRIFSALAYLGLGIFDARSLERVGGYNLYTDLDAHEDWFGGMDVATQVADAAFLDPGTGMPGYLQASYEIREVWHGGVQAPTPWADFEITGKYYYDARDAHVAELGGRTIAYLAYGLGGLVAVDVSGHEAARPDARLRGRFLGFLPAVPAHGGGHGSGGGHSTSLYSQEGAGRLKEAGTVGVALRADDLYFTDHFGGLLAVSDAHQPELRWRGPEAPYDNDTNGVPGDHLPPYESVTSFDMRPLDPDEEESPPRWMYGSPAKLATGGTGGHGGSLRLAAGFAPGDAGQVDALVATGAGGLALLDIQEPGGPGSRQTHEVLALLATTDEDCAVPPGAQPAALSIGHTDALASSSAYLYVADGPHGLSVWSLLDDQGFPAGELHLVANTLQSEHPLVLGSETLYPATHAHGVLLDPSRSFALASCRTVGLRRVPVGPVEAGLRPSAPPLLLRLSASDLFEHKRESGNVGGLSKQDHASDVALAGQLAFVADGNNGLTIYDLGRDPSGPDGSFLVANLGGAAGEDPLLGNTSGVALWSPAGGTARYALLAAGPKGIAVVDVSEPASPELVKLFQPKASADHGHGSKLDGRSVDVEVAGELAFLSYDTSGVLAYACADLIAPLPPGVDPVLIHEGPGSAPSEDHRPDALGHFRLQDLPEHGEAGGGAQRMCCVEVGGERTLYVAWGDAGLARVQWSDPASPRLLELHDTVGECLAVTVSSGRVFAADGKGGLVALE